MNPGSITVAVDPEIMRDLVELSLIEEYHWTPQYISTLPYKWIQKHNYMKKVKNSTIDVRNQKAMLKNQSKMRRN
jgi:hypothetical protein